MPEETTTTVTETAAEAAAASAAATGTETGTEERTETLPEPPKGPQSRRETAQRLHEALAEKERERAAATGSEKTPEETAAGTETKAGETATGTETTTETEKEPEPKGVVVDLESHPAAQGQKSITVGSEQEARVLRGILNGTYVRPRQLQVLEAENADLKRQLGEHREKLFRREAAETAAEKFKETPEYKAAVTRYQKMKVLEEQGELDPGSADDYWKGAMAKLNELTDVEYKTRVDGVTKQEQQRQAEVFAEDAWETAQSYPKEIVQLPAFRSMFIKAMQRFNDALNRGDYPEVKDHATGHAAFAKEFQAVLVAEPAVQSAYQAMQKRLNEEQAEKDRAEQERKQREGEAAAVERARREAAETRERVPPHPIGTVAVASLDRAPAPGEETDKSSVFRTPSQIKREAKAQALEFAKRRGGGT